MATATVARRRVPEGDGAEVPAGPRRPADLLSRSVPSTRAVAGGLLIALAALVAFVAARGGEADAGPALVVAARDLAPGTRLTPADLELRRVAGGAALSGVAGPEELVGGVTLGPLGRGDLVQRATVSAAGDGPAAYELALALPAERAVQDRLRPGERVDVLATFGTGPSARTEVVVRDAVVRTRSSSDGAFASGEVTVTLGLHDAAVVLAVAHAQRAGEVTLVRSTGAPAVADAPTAWPTAPTAPPVPG